MTYIGKAHIIGTSVKHLQIIDTSYIQYMALTPYMGEKRSFTLV